MSGNPSLDTVTERMNGLFSSMQKIETDLEKISSSMSQLVEFRKEAEFLNQKIQKLESSRNHMLDEMKEIQLSTNSQKTLNRIMQTLLGLASSAALAIGIFMAGGSRATDSQLNTIERDISLLKYQITQKMAVPSVQVNQNDPKDKN